MFETFQKDPVISTLRTTQSDTIYERYTSTVHCRNTSKEEGPGANSRVTEAREYTRNKETTQAGNRKRERERESKCDNRTEIKECNMKQVSKRLENKRRERESMPYPATNIG